MPDNMNHPFFFHANKRFEALVGRSGPFEHWFGDSGLSKIVNPPKIGAVQQLLDLDLSDPRLGIANPSIRRLPLFYGFQFEDGFMEYEVLGDCSIRILKLDESSFYNTWPYANYPANFPKLPLDITDPESSTIETFQQDVWQWIDPKESGKFIAIVPPSSLYGVHLWQEDSDFDDVHVKFFFDPVTNHVRIYNECD